MLATHIGHYNTTGSRTHVRFHFSTHAAAGGNVAPLSAFEAADIRIYRAADSAAFSATQRASSSGITMTSPFDSLTGFHDLDIDLGDNTDAGFYAAGYLYSVVLAPDTETVDSQTLTGVVLAYFEIGPPNVNVTHAAGTAWGSGAITAASIAADAITDAKVASDVTIASVTGAVGSVTGNVGGNVTGSVGSVASGGITSASFAAGAINAAAIAADAIGASELAADAVAEIAAGVWDLATSGHTTGGTFGAAMVAAGSAGDPWSTSLPGAYSAGTAGFIVGTNLNATVSSRLATAGYTAPSNLTAAQIATGVWQDTTAGDFTVASSIGKSLYTTGNAPGAASGLALVNSAMTLTSGERTSIADALLDQTAGVETGRTVRQSLRLMLAALVGRLSGAATSTVAIRDTNNTKDRITASVDADGNRTTVTLDGT